MKPTEPQSRKEQMERLHKLREVVQMHVDAKGEPVRLNGAIRGFNMTEWDCGSSACAFGSYVLTPFGQRFFEIIGSSISERDKPFRPCAEYEISADHFGITDCEAEWLFSPNEYFVGGAMHDEDLFGDERPILIDTDEEPEIDDTGCGIIPPEVVLARIDRIIEEYSPTGH